MNGSVVYIALPNFFGSVNVAIALFSKFPINILATIGDNGEPMGSPSVCVNSFSLKVNTVDLRQNEHTFIRSVGESCVLSIRSVLLSNLFWITSRAC